MSTMDGLKERYNKSADSIITDYKEYEKALLVEYKAHCETVKSLWSDNDAVESTPREWVEYNDDLSHRSIVDFEDGEVKVEILLDLKDLDNEELIDVLLEKAVEELFESKGKSMNYKSKYEQQRTLSNSPILDLQVDLQEYGINPREILKDKRRQGPPTPKLSKTSVLPERSSNSSKKTGIKPRDSKETMVERNKREPEEIELRKKEIKQVKKKESLKLREIEEVAKVIVKKTKHVVVKKTTKEGKKIAVVSLNLKLVEDHISIRAAKFKDMVAKYSKVFAIDEPLIYAIMEQESSFNPAAKSWVPAYGLMQLVPRSGGLDANRFVHKRDKMPTANYLYDPDNNIELGTGYLKLLKTTSFSRITDDKSQLLCMIAAYNAGAGNVSRAIIGSTNLPKAIPLINDMDHEELYKIFRSNLPDETKDYLYKVTRNIQKYSK